MLNNDGSYRIFVSNGYSPNAALNSAINSANKNQFASTAVALILTNGLKTISDNDECRQKINEFHATQLTYINNSIISGTPPTNEELLNYLEASSLAIADSMNECIVGNKLKKFISVIIGTIGGVFNNALESLNYYFLLETILILIFLYLK